MLRPSPNHGTQRLPNDDDEIKCVLELFGNFTTFFRIHDTYIVVIMATVRPILLKPFLWIPIHILGQNRFDLHDRKH